MAWIAALCSLSMEASQCAENCISHIVNIDLDRGVGLLVLGVEEPEVATEIDQGGELVVELEFDALAAADVLDRHFAQRRRLVFEPGPKNRGRVALRGRFRRTPVKDRGRWQSQGQSGSPMCAVSSLRYRPRGGSDSLVLDRGAACARRIRSTAAAVFKWRCCERGFRSGVDASGG